jgi:hypothetical protein
MTTLNWKPFSAEWPICAWIWISDYKIVRLATTLIYNGEDMNRLVWAEAKIDYPPVPEKKMHRCTNGGSDCFIAQEDENGFFLSYGANQSVHSRVYVNIVACPFCGWSKEKA